jgi:type IV pilus assembly protein PilA
MFHKYVMSRKLNKGFTLIELLVVIGILGILLAIVLIAINPARQFKQANNTKRANDAATLLNAIHQYGADHKGVLPADMPAAADGDVEISAAGANICADIMPTYVASLAVDPTRDGGAGEGVVITDCATANYTTGYLVSVDTDGRVTVTADLTAVDVIEGGAKISVTR